MAMQALRNGASGGILKFFLLGLLCLAGGGLVFTDVGGFFRGGVSGNNVAKIGKEAVSLNTFDRVTRRTLSQIGLSPTQAYQLGYIDQILSSEIRRRLLMNAATDTDILLGKDYVVKQIHSILAPALKSGMSAEQALSNLLRGQGITESELSATILSERTLSILGDAMEAGALQTPKEMADLLYQYSNETRAIRYLSYPNADYKKIEKPTDEQLNTLYQSLKENFAIPERRDINIATIDTKAVADTITIDEAQMRAFYEDSIDLYKKPAIRTISQAVFKTEEDANASLDKIKESNFEKTAKAQNADYLPAKTFGEDSILDELKEPVFTAEKTGIIGPIKTPLGWSIVNLSKITQEHTRSFDDVKAEIKKEMIDEQLIDEIYKLVDEVDEFFAVGGTLDDAQKQFNLSIESFKGINNTGLDTNNEAALTKSAGTDSVAIIQTAYELDEGATGTAQELNDGRFVVVNTATITPKTYTPFEDVKDILETKWLTDQRDMSNRNDVMAIQKENEETPLADIAKTENKTFKTIDTIKRDDEASPLSPTAHNSIFNAKIGEHFMIDTKDGVALAEVTAINKAKTPDEKELEPILILTEQEMQNELLVLYLNKLQKKYPTKTNQALLQKAYGSSGDQNESY